MFGVDNNDTRAMYFIVNDPTEKLLKFMAEENEKSRKQEMEMMKLMFSQKHPPCPLQRIPFHQNHVTVERKGNSENQVSFYNVLEAPPSPTYNPTWPTYQGKHQK